jgi:hypothetical protein
MRRFFPALLLLVGLSSSASAQELAGNYIGPWPFLFAPTVIRDPNLHRPTVQYPKPAPVPGVVINNTVNNYLPQPSADPVVVTNPTWVAPVTGDPIKIRFGGAPVAAPAPKPVINRYR